MALLARLLWLKLAIVLFQMKKEIWCRDKLLQIILMAVANTLFNVSEG